MNLQSKAGEKIYCESRNAGSKSDVEKSLKFLKLGHVYTIKTLFIEGWNSKVELEEIPHEFFNTVSFENVPDQLSLEILQKRYYAIRKAWGDKLYDALPMNKFGQIIINELNDSQKELLDFEKLSENYPFYAPKTIGIYGLQKNNGWEQMDNLPTKDCNYIVRMYNEETKTFKYIEVPLHKGKFINYSNDVITHWREKDIINEPLY